MAFKQVIIRRVGPLSWLLGGKVRKLCIGTFLLASTLAHAQDSIAIRETTDNSFVAALTSDSELSVEEAQRRVLTTAKTTCNDRIPKFGHYDFKSSKSMSASTTDPSTFEFNQEFTCQEKTEEVSGHESSTTISEEKKGKLVELVTRETRKFIDTANRETLIAFHAKFSPELSTMLPITEWAEQQGLLHQNSGAIKDNPQFKVTTYVDPPNSPGPGVYIAVDFQANYEGAPYRCGYVMWLFDQASNLTVLRIEDGVIYNKDAASMTSEEIEQAKQQFLCFAP